MFEVQSEVFGVIESNPMPFHKLLPTLFATVFLISCASAPPLADPNIESHKPAIIFIPGFYGTALADAQTQDRVFITASTFLFSSQPLGLDLPELALPHTKHLRPDGILESVSIVPLLYTLDIYASILTNLRETFGATSQIHALAYDWRQDNLEAVHALSHLITELKNKGAPSVALIAHSMGGLIATYYLRYGDQDLDHAQETWEGANQVKAVIIGGTPFGGTVTAFRNLQLGTAVGLSEQPLNALNLASFPSMYQLMSAPELGSIVTKDLVPAGENIFDPTLWRKYGWGNVGTEKDTSRPVRESRLYYRDRQLKRAREFLRLIRAPGLKPVTRSSALIFAGQGRTTLAKAIWDANNFEQNAKWIFENKEMGNVFYGDGDGTVTLASAQPPEALGARFRMKVVLTAAKHTAVFSDEGVQKELKAYLKEAGF